VCGRSGCDSGLVLKDGYAGGVRARQIFAFSGMLVQADDQRSNADLTDYALTLTPPATLSRPTRVCYVPTAVGDSPVAIESKRREFATRWPHVEFSVLSLFTQPSVSDVRSHLLGQDLLLVEGGSVVNLMAVWRAHRLRQVFRECWNAGVVLAGASAGSLCWHTGGPTDSFGDDPLWAFTDGLALVPYSNSVHDDFPDQPRRSSYRQMVAAGELPAGYATEDGVGLHYVGDRLHRVVSLRPHSGAWWIEPNESRGYIERAVRATDVWSGDKQLS